MLGECFALQGARDALPRGRTPHALTLTYKLSLVEDGKITPRLPMMNGWEAFSIILQLCGHQIFEASSISWCHGRSARAPHKCRQQHGGLIVKHRTLQSPSGCVSACRYVYDGVLEAQFIMVHDANKQLLGVADIYPGAHLQSLHAKPCQYVP